MGFKFKKNKRTVIFSLFCAVVCLASTPIIYNRLVHQGVGELSLAEKKLKLHGTVSSFLPFVKGRSPTSQGAPVCFRDRFNDVESIRREIAQLESATTGEPLSGVVFGMDLSRMPRAQAAYLVAHQSWMQMEGIDYSSCQDLLCALGRLYTETSNKAPLLHYLFYLKTNYGIATKISLPHTDISSLHLPLSSYLFSEEELKIFVESSFALPQQVLRMPLLSTIHRVPSGHGFTGSLACARTSSRGSERTTIRFADACLRSPGSQNSYVPLQLANTGYGLLFHELNHVLDSMWGSVAGNTFDGNAFSEKEEWRSFSGWHRVEGADPATHAAVSRWQSEPNAEGFVWYYAGEQPAEDFAETLNYVRFSPENAIARSPLKAAFLTQRVFNGRKYTLDGLQDYYVAEMGRRLQPQLPNIIQRCLVSPEQTVPPRYVSRYHFRFPVLPAVSLCLENSLDNQIRELANQLKFEEMEACSYFETREADFIRQSSLSLEPILATLLEQNQQLAPQLRASERLRQQLATQVDGRELYLSCSGQGAPQTCFDAAVLQAFDTVVAPLAADLGSLLEIEKQRFLNENNFTTTRDRTLSLFRSIFMGIEPHLHLEARDRWAQCRNETSVQGAQPNSVVVTPYTGGARYIAAPIITCINTTMASAIDGVLSRWLRRLGMAIDGEPARALMRNDLQNRYMGFINEMVDAEFNQELAFRNNRFLAITPGLVSTLVADRSWFARDTTESGVLSHCFEQASQRIEGILNGEPAAEGVNPSLGRLRFIARADLVVQWSQEVCVQVLSSAEVQRQLEGNGASLWTAAMRNLQSILNTKVVVAVEQCRNQNLGTSQIMMRRRASCLTAAPNWNNLESAALSDWQQTQDGQRFANRLRDVREYMNSRRGSWQNQALRQMEARP